MKLQESGEMYLEHILVLREKQGAVRSVDVAAESGYSKPSVSRAMGLLREAGLISIDAGGYITLTEEGEKVAGSVYERHRVLTDLFQKMGVPEKTAEDDACKIEHVISEETFQALKKCLGL